jgi:hypothetical protein
MPIIEPTLTQVGERIMTEEKKRSLVVSTLGTNAFYIPYCEIEKYSPNYAACLCRADKMKEDARYKKSWANCADAIANGTCEAQKMRAQEIEAGECLFFVQRTNTTAAPIPKSDISVPNRYRRKASEKEMG